MAEILKITALCEIAVKTSIQIAVCVFLVVLCVAVMLVYRQLQARTQVVHQTNLEKRFLESQLGEQRYRRQIAEVARFEQILENTRLYYLHPGVDFDRVALQTIFDFAPVLEECVAISAESDWEALSLKAAAGENLARVCLLQNRVDDAERQLRASLAAYSSMASLGYDKIAGMGNQSTSIRIGLVQNRLACMLNALGRYEEAARLWQDSIDTLAQQQHVYGDPVSLELAISMRNLGLTRLCLTDSDDGLLEKSLQMSREICSRLSDATRKESNVSSMTVFAVAAEFHIDTCQLLHARLWQRGQFEKSEAVAQESLESLQQLILLVERTLSHCPWQRYQKSFQAAKANLTAMVAEMKIQPTAQTMKLPGGWHWQPLYFIPGETIFQECLTQGHIHAEFEPHDGLMVSWSGEGWGDHAIVQIVAAASRRMRVCVLVADDVYEDTAREAFLAAGISIDQITFWRVNSGTLWIRDFGPNVIQTSPGGFSCLDNFYVHGGRSREDFLPRHIADRLGMVTIPSNLHLMGGEFVTNGAGLCIASTSVLENNRENGLSDTETVSRLKRLTGSDELVFLEPLSDEPPRHVDWFATFTATDTVVVGDYRNLDAHNAAILNRNAERLSRLKTSSGPLKVVRIPMPPRAETFFGGTYTNVVFANGVLLVPTWPGTPRELEEEAIRTYQQLLPDWEIVGVDCSQLGVKNGALHCATVNLYRMTAKVAAPESADETERLRLEKP